jgi:hypothetical protein
MTALLNTLIQYRNFTQKKLHTLVQNYASLSLGDIMSEVESVFADLKGVFTLGELMAAESNDPKLKEAYTVYAKAHTEALENFELLLFRHVDEPDGSFIEGLNKFEAILLQLFTPEYEKLMGDIQQSFTETQTGKIQARLSQEQIAIPVAVFQS